MNLWILNLLLFLGFLTQAIYNLSVANLVVLAIWYLGMVYNYHVSFRGNATSWLWFMQFPKSLQLELTPLPLEVYVRISLMMSMFPELRTSLIKIVESPTLRKQVMSTLPYSYPRGMCNKVLKVCLTEGYISVSEHSTYMQDASIIETLPELTHYERNLHV